MATYQISNNVSGHIFGTYEAESAAEAIRAMHRDAGYEDGEWPPGSNDDLTVTEVEPLTARIATAAAESMTALLELLNEIGEENADEGIESVVDITSLPSTGSDPREVGDYSGQDVWAWDATEMIVGAGEWRVVARPSAIVREACAQLNLEVPAEGQPLEQWADTDAGKAMVEAAIGGEKAKAVAQAYLDALDAEDDGCTWQDKHGELCGKDGVALHLGQWLCVRHQREFVGR